MYVEISGRQTGKTTRMVNDIVHRLIDTNDNIVIIGHNQDYFRRLKVKLESELLNTNHDSISIDMVRTFLIDRRIRFSYDMSTPSYDHWCDYYYVDEFAFLPVDWCLSIKENAYYCSTPNGDNHFTIGLMNYCRHNNITINHYPLHNSTRDVMVYHSTSELRNYDAFIYRYGIEQTIGFRGIEPIKNIKKHLM